MVPPRPNGRTGQSPEKTETIAWLPPPPPLRATAYHYIHHRWQQYPILCPPILTPPWVFLATCDRQWSEGDDRDPSVFSYLYGVFPSPLFHSGFILSFTTIVTGFRDLVKVYPASICHQKGIVCKYSEVNGFHCSFFHHRRLWNFTHCGLNSDNTAEACHASLFSL